MKSSVCPILPAIRTGCVNRARPGPCGGRGAIPMPAATEYSLRGLRHGHQGIGSQAAGIITSSIRDLTGISDFNFISAQQHMPAAP
jgi:hypothetical protein